ncbi:carbonic anhydrase [Bacillus sp. FJAT-45037]|uniref:carbonic anhydrase n=1 Tax=Bacillus sp. FJAT-45037 TaxID=2011007 RepID=UPI000C23C1E4|nr:carbonic anhydrase [Bacillus sp. FJAT-45037]
MEKHRLEKQNESFLQEMREKDPHFFEKLQAGQEPEMFVLACSDSRVSPSVITNMPLGKLFIHRNIANQVNESDESFSASLYYALKHLRVKDVLIIGHTNCGGVKAAADNNEEAELKTWLTSIHQAIKGADCEGLCEAGTKQNVLTQMDRLKAHPIYRKYGNDVPVVGALFHVEDGKFEWLR